jgi:glycosyltransferase involved in cell wall biosynthesis
VIIPAYNEAETIGDIVKKIIVDLYPRFEIIVVNDGSTDETAEVAKDAGAIVYSHPYNIGNGAAIKSGIRIASGKSWYSWTAMASMIQRRYHPCLPLFRIMTWLWEQEEKDIRPRG